MTGISYDVESEKLISGSITAISQMVDMTGPNSGTDVIQITGVWSGTIVAEGSQDGSSYFTLPFVVQSTGANGTAITSNDTYIVATNGYSQTRIRSSAWTSGTAAITVYGANYPSVVYSAEDKNFGTVGVNTSRTASQIGNSTGAADFNAGATGAQTLRVAANQGAPNSNANSWPTKVTDGTNVASVSTHNDIGVADGIGSGGVYGSITLTLANTAYEAKIGVSRLSGRKSLTITPMDNDIYWGYTNDVTISSGTPIFKNQFTEFCLDPGDANVQVWLVCASAGKTVRVTESQ